MRISSEVRTLNIARACQVGHNLSRSPSLHTHARRSPEPVGLTVRLWQTRLATIRHCATKLPLLLLLYLLCPTDPFKPSPRPVNAAPPTSSPFRSTLYALSLLLILVRPLVLTLDESLARAILANPFPPRRLPHQDRRRHSRPRSLRDWSKRVSQLGWRAHSIWQRGRFPLLALLLTGFLLLAVPIGDLLQQVQHESEQGWSVVAGRWLSSRRLEAGSANTARGWKPLRNVVWLEVRRAFGRLSPLTPFPVY